MIALDSNILIYAHRSGVPEHRAAMRAIEDVAGNAGRVGHRVSLYRRIFAPW